MLKIWKVTLPKLTKKQKRNAYIYLPDSYEEEPEKRYPVLYMFDGHNVFLDSHATYGKSWGMQEYMERTGTQMIIVAVECNHSPDHGRLKEYSPFPLRDSRFGTFRGKGKLTMEWFVHTLKKEIDGQYRTIPDRSHTFIAGSSMGGLMSLYALLEYNAYFSKAAALSPSVWVSPAGLTKLINHAELDPATELYMDYGSNEFGNHDDMRRKFFRVSAQLSDRGIAVTTRIVPEGYHCEASWEKQIPFFMSMFLYDLDQQKNDDLGGTDESSVL